MTVSDPSAGHVLESHSPTTTYSQSPDQRTSAGLPAVGLSRECGPDHTENSSTGPRNHMAPMLSDVVFLTVHVADHEEETALTLVLGHVIELGIVGSKECSSRAQAQPDRSSLTVCCPIAPVSSEQAKALL